METQAPTNDPSTLPEQGQDPAAYMAGLLAKGKEKPAVQETKAEEKAEEKAQEPEGDLSKAQSAIKRKFGAAADSMLATMTERQVEALGTQLAADLKRYNDQANELDRLKTAQSSNRHDDTEAEQDDDDGDPDDTVRPSEEADPFDLSEAMGSLDADLYGEELPDALTKVGRTIQERAEAATAELRSLQMEILDGDVRRELAERFPSLQDEATAAELTEKMALLEPGMTYSKSMDIRARRTKLMEHALVLVDPNAAVESKGTSNQSRGGPRPPVRRGKVRPMALSPQAARIEYQRLRGKGLTVLAAKEQSGLLAEK